MRGSQRGRSEDARRADLLGRQMAAAPWNGDCKCGSYTELALGRDCAAMQLDQFVHQSQANAGAFVGAAAGTRHAMEALEQLWQFMRGYSRAGITHRQDEVRARFP